MAETLDSLLQILVETEADTSGVQMFRGQADYNWEPIPTLYRRLLQNGYSRHQISEPLLLAYETDLLCESNGLGFYRGNRLQTMVELQHHGGATRLLDVTRDIFTALWFASERTEPNTDGVLIAYVLGEEWGATSETVSDWNALSEGLMPGTAVAYFPLSEEERVKAQRGGFLSTALTGTLSDGSAFTDDAPGLARREVRIPKDLKAPLRSFLRNSRGMRQYTVYPDFTGYAMSHSVSAPFPRVSDDLYTGEAGLFPKRFSPPYQ